MGLRVLLCILLSGGHRGRRLLTLGRGSMLAKSDAKHAYRQIPVHPDDRLVLPFLRHLTPVLALVSSSHLFDGQRRVTMGPRGIERDSYLPLCQRFRVRGTTPL